MNMTMKSTSKTNLTGFTLIELVVVIALLGILAAFAIPRFVGLEREARAAAMLGVSGSVRSSATLAHSMWLAQGVNPVILEGNPVTLTEGYPDAADIALTLSDLTGFSVAVNGGADQATFSKNGAPGTCEVVYNDALPGTAPIISVDLDGC